MTRTSPESSLERLLAGNERFATGRTESPRRALERARELASGQSPYAAVLGCADSRVPPEILFDEGLGDLFTVRVAGNVATPVAIASLEFAVGVLGANVVLVLGHRSCGAVTAALERPEVPGSISVLFEHIEPGITGSKTVEDAVSDNVRRQAEAIRGSSSIVRDALAAGALLLRGAVYDLEDGRVRLLE